MPRGRMVYVVCEDVLVFASDDKQDPEFTAAVAAAERRAMARVGLSPEDVAMALETAPLVRITIDRSPDLVSQRMLAQAYRAAMRSERLH